MDCEMVGLGPLRESGLARCSLVDYYGAVLYDKFIRPEGEITDYRTLVSGITPRHMEDAMPFAVARLEVSGAGRRVPEHGPSLAGPLAGVPPGPGEPARAPRAEGRVFPGPERTISQSEVSMYSHDPRWPRAPTPFPLSLLRYLL